MNIIFLLFLHHVGDVWAQPSWLIANKKKHLFAIYEHAFVWSGIVSLGLWALGIFEPWKFVFLIAVHFLIDAARYQWVPRKEEYWWIYPDQALHYIQIAVVYFLK